MSEAEIVKWVIAAVLAVIDVATKLGYRDAALAALDGSLALARKKTDEDLDAKHAHDAPTLAGNQPPTQPGEPHSARGFDCHDPSCRLGCPR